MSDEIVIDAASRFRPLPPLRYTGDDPGILAASRLPLQAGLASRVRCMIVNGSTDEVIDLYVEGWLQSTRDGPNDKLHRELDALRRGLRPEEN